MFVKHTISQLYQILRTMKLANILFFVKANMEEIVCDFYTTEAYWCHIDTFFFIYHTFICKIYNSMWIMHTLICKFSTLVCKIYSIICKIHTLIRKIHTFTWKLVWYIKIKSVNLAPIRVRTIQTLIYSYLELQLFFFFFNLLISLCVTIHITCTFT